MRPTPSLRLRRFVPTLLGRWLTGAATLAMALILGGRADAALVDVNYNAIRGTPISEVLISALCPHDGVLYASDDPPTPVPGDASTLPPAPVFNPTGGLQRVLISWANVKSPPVIRFFGLNTALQERTLAKGVAAVTTPIGPAWPLPNVPGFYFAVVSPTELEVSTLATLLTATRAPPPEPSGHALHFSGPATDLKLGDLQPLLKDFSMSYESNGDTKIIIRANSEDAAKHVDRWVWWRKPIVFAGADIGVKKLQFPAKLLDQTIMVRDKDELIATTTLHDDMQTQAFNILADAIRKQLRNFKPHVPPATTGVVAPVPVAGASIAAAVATPAAAPTAQADTKLDSHK